MHNYSAFRIGAVSVSSVLILSLNSSSAALYSGNGQPADGAVSGGTLQLTDNGTTVSATFTRGSGAFADNIVIFVDSVSGGFGSTGGFADKSSVLTRNISGINGDASARSVATFASGFAADYAVAVGYDNYNGGVYRLANGLDDSLEFLGNVVLTPHDSQTSSSYTFSFNLSDIGLPAGSGNYFKFESSYLTSLGSRTLQSFQSLSGTAGYNPVTFGTYSTYGVDPIPEPVNVALVVLGGIAVTGGLVSRVRGHLCRNAGRA
jgi:hypothetical protein